MMPARYDISFVIGTTTPFQFGLSSRRSPDDDYEPLPLDDVRLTFYHRGQLLLRRTLVVDPPESPGGIELVDDYEGVYRWTPTPEETRLFPSQRDGVPYAAATYELEVRSGDSQLVYLMGNVIAVGGINDD